VRQCWYKKIADEYEWGLVPHTMHAYDIESVYTFSRKKKTSCQVRTHAGIVTSWLTAELTNMFPSEETIVKVKCPTLIVHGAVDRVSEGMGWGGGAGMREGGSDGHVLERRV
jgi:hypothetical protein